MAQMKNAHQDTCLQFFLRKGQVVPVRNVRTDFPKWDTRERNAAIAMFGDYLGWDFASWMALNFSIMFSNFSADSMVWSFLRSFSAMVVLSGYAL